MWLGALIAYLVILALFAIVISSPVPMTAVLIGWFASTQVTAIHATRVASLTAVASLSVLAFVACFFVDGTGEVVFVIVMASLWTIPVLWASRALANRRLNGRFTHGGRA
jgi:hypothetical protein